MFKQIAKRVVPGNIRNQIRLGIGKRLTFQRVKNILKSGTEIRLEIGAGPVKGKQGWITLDLGFESDLFWDLREGLPFPDNSVSVIYASHVLEHFYYPQLMKLLKDCLRVLKPGGIFSACVPNARLYLDGYHNPASFDKSYLRYTPAICSDLRIDIVNYIAYMDGHHKYMFDEENLIYVLKQVGFNSVHPREFDPNLDPSKRKHESLYVCCSK